MTEEPVYNVPVMQNEIKIELNASEGTIRISMSSNTLSHEELKASMLDLKEKLSINTDKTDKKRENSFVG